MIRPEDVTDAMMTALHEQYDYAGRRKIRQTRLNWIDDLIRYFEEKE